MSDVTIVYYTCNTLDPSIAETCQRYLLQAACGKPIISVSQKPMDFGQNICVGPIGRSHISLFTQILAGARAATTRFIALAEHDCLYTPEHFNWRPPTDALFYYNVNHWFADWQSSHAGMYSYYRRKVLSNLICNRQLLIDAVEEKLALLKSGAKIRKGQPGACEFGVVGRDKALIDLPDDLGKDVRNYRAIAFSTILPNIDIRHSGNFSGNRRTRNEKYTLPYWGSFHAVMGVPPPGAWYQEATIDGVPMLQRRKTDTNEKRWHKYIKPHIRLTEGQITDLGCNAGFYCRKFRDLGFRAIGVERSMEFLRHAHYWETKEPRGVRFIESDITQYTLTCSHYVLLANVHYWLTPKQLEDLVAQLRAKALNVILIGRYKPYHGHKSPGDLEFLIKLFAGWKQGKVIPGDKHFSVIFHNPDLVAMKIDDIFHFQQLAKSKKFLPSYNNLIDRVLVGEKFDPHETPYFEYLVWRRHRNREQLLQRHIDLIHSMRDIGIREPLTIGRVIRGDYVPNRLTDGDHRLIVAKKLGMGSVICKVLRPNA